MKNQKIDMSRKKDLKILVEDYLEQDSEVLEKLYYDQRVKALDVFSRIFQLLCDPPDDVNDLKPAELKEVVLGWHPIVIPVWKKIKEAYLDYRDNVLPEREKHKKMVSVANDPSSSLVKYKDLIKGGYGLIAEEKPYPIKLKRAPITINLSLSSDKFSISTKGIRIVDNLLLHIKDSPIDIFSICGYCDKIIIITRKGKSYHSGCAAKAKQKELWEKDPEGCREKERNRYRKRLEIELTSSEKPVQTVKDV